MQKVAFMCNDESQCHLRKGDGSLERGYVLKEEEVVVEIRKEIRKRENGEWREEEEEEKDSNAQIYPSYI